MNAQNEDTCPGMTTRTRTGEASSSPNKGLGSGSGPGMDAPLASPTHPDSSQPLQSPVTRDHSVIPPCWKDLDRTNILSSSPLRTYGLWCTCVYDEEDSTAVLPLAPFLDGDIFGVGKRPVQHEIEIDGCVRLVFVEE
jgi:hypothetical protein